MENLPVVAIVLILILLSLMAAVIVGNRSDPPHNQ